MKQINELKLDKVRDMDKDKDDGTEKERSLIDDMKEALGRDVDLLEIE